MKNCRLYLLILSVGLFAQAFGQKVEAKLDPAVLYSRALVSKGNEGRLQSFFEKARQGLPVTFGVIGGSITQNAKASTSENRYANRIAAWLRQQFPSTTVKLVNAGIGGTGSNYGCLRSQNDLLTYSPDLVIIEFSVNDSALQEKSLPTYEGLVRQVLETPAAVLLLFTMNSISPDTENMENLLMPGTKPVVMDGVVRGGNVQYWHAQIGRHYDLPMISYRDAIWPEMASGKVAWADFQADRVHPNDAGHKVVAELITSYLSNVFASFDALSPAQSKGEQVLPPALISDRFVRVEYKEAKDLEPVHMNGWTRGVYRDGSTIWTADRPGSEISFSGTSAGVQAVIQTVVKLGGKAEFTVNSGTPIIRSCQHDRFSLPIVVNLLNSDQEEPWTVTIKVLPPDQGSDSTVRLRGLAELN
jgi:lysophospholipase L1-like esterase